MLLGFKTSVVIGDEVALSFVLSTVAPGDVIIGFGFSGYARDVAAALQIGRERGATTIGISGSDVSAVARSADIVLVCSAVSSMQLPSETAATALIESMFVALGAERQQTFQRTLKEFGATHDLLVSRKSASGDSVHDSILKVY
jgi:DNA-binding MurR/RpiR family transcriptional regulator